MEGFVGEEEGILEIPVEDADVFNTNFPVNAASYGRTMKFLPKYIKYAFRAAFEQLEILC